MRGEPRDWDLRADALSAGAIAEGRPTAWFDELYAEGRAGEISLPWDRIDPNPLLREWVEGAHPSGDGRRAVVVGCGLGADAAYLAELGFDVLGFDVSPVAIDIAVERHGASGADFRVADLLDLPVEWLGAFDLVVEIFTIQALPDPPRDRAIVAVSELVAPGGTLMAVAFRREDLTPAGEGPPYPLTRRQVESLAVGDLAVVKTEALSGARWRVEIRFTTR